MEPEDWWYFVKVLRCLKKRLYKDVKNMNMIEKKTFFKVNYLFLFCAYKIKYLYLNASRCDTINPVKLFCIQA